MTRLQQLVLLKQLETCNLALQFGKLNEDKRSKVESIKAEIVQKLYNVESK